tara:strand:+ start:56627 stop:57265 length:639 start_codon:yes stop_codon:yes gene_type:complete
MHSLKILDNLEQFDHDVQWVKHKKAYRIPDTEGTIMNNRNFQHFKIRNFFFKTNKTLFLQTPVVELVKVMPNKNRFQIGGYHLFVRSEKLKADLKKLIKKWDYLNILDRQKVLLQFTEYRKDYWNHKLLTVFEFEKFHRGRNQWLSSTTEIYNNLIHKVGVGIDLDPQRAWPKKAKITFEITMHHFNPYPSQLKFKDCITYIRLVARQVQFL